MDGEHIRNEQRWLLKFDQCELFALVDVARDSRIDFFKACAIVPFQNQFVRGQNTIGSHLNMKRIKRRIIIEGFWAKTS